MYTPPISQKVYGIDPIDNNSSDFSLKWIDELDLKVVQSKSTSTQEIVKNVQLNYTHLLSTVCTEAGQWRNRKVFIKKILNDLLTKCPKDEPLVLISLGSHHLLMEYILGKALIENGFQDITFMLIDPDYIFSDKEQLKIIKHVLTDFRENIESIYFKKFNRPFEKDRIRYLSRAQNISKYLKGHPSSQCSFHRKSSPLF